MSAAVAGDGASSQAKVPCYTGQVVGFTLAQAVVRTLAQAVAHTLGRVGLATPARVAARTINGTDLLLTVSSEPA
jgi:hypothetical protein